ncbi:MAG TPA: hypothetical protein VMU26_01935 [Candidatus Polarisedimenticolia bacterium]|nr:hypothetical protein [Candidatus Polarisedimenticolia bacterium]
MTTELQELQAATAELRDHRLGVEAKLEALQEDRRALRSAAGAMHDRMPAR